MKLWNFISCNIWPGNVQDRDGQRSLPGLLTTLRLPDVLPDVSVLIFMFMRPCGTHETDFSSQWIVRRIHMLVVNVVVLIKWLKMFSLRTWKKKCFIARLHGILRRKNIERWVYVASDTGKETITSYFVEKKMLKKHLLN